MHCTLFTFMKCKHKLTKLLWILSSAGSPNMLLSDHWALDAVHRAHSCYYPVLDNSCIIEKKCVCVWGGNFRYQWYGIEHYFWVAGSAATSSSCLGCWCTHSDLEWMWDPCGYNPLCTQADLAVALPYIQRFVTFYEWWKQHKKCVKCGLQSTC